jgi:O-antigen/teichoic acid export membrane protein
MSKLPRKVYRSIGMLAGGSIIGQVFNVALMPFITRIYSPEEFGFYSVFIAVVAIVAVVACGRFEIAIPIPIGQTASNGITAISIILSVLTLVVVLFISLTLPNIWIETRFGGWIASNIWIIAISVWVTSFYSILNYISNRKKEFRKIAVGKITHVTSTVGSQLALGILGATNSGLFIGHVVGIAAAIVLLFSKRLVRTLFVFKRRTRKLSSYVWNNYKDYPRFSALDSLFNTIGIQLPIILIAALSTSSEAGFLMLSMKVMGAPLALLGTAIGHVYLSQLSSEINNKNIKIFTKKVLFMLATVGVIPLILMGVISESAFIFIFGDEWGRAGELVTWMIPWFIFQLLSSPISMIMPATNSKISMLALTLFGMTLRVGSVVIFGVFFGDFTVEAFAISSACFYLLCLVVFYNKASSIDSIETISK